MTIQDEIAQRIDKVLDGDCGYGVGESLADSLMPLVRKAQAEALRDAALTEFQPTFGVGYSGIDAQERLFRKADRIEQNSEGGT